KVIFAIVMSIFGLCAVPQITFAAEEGASVYAFPDRFMLRAGTYFVDSTNTQFSINSNDGIGAGSSIDFKKDLGGDERDTIPRIDAYYRFNDYHRIDFTAFSISRAGRRTLTGEIVIGDTTYPVDETLSSEIKYTLYKVGYSYSFYRSPKVELSFSAGLNITKYDLSFSDQTGANAQAAGVTVPLPVFGLRMGYMLSPKWSMQYVVEAFAIKLEDKFRGSLLNFELNTEYRLFKNFALGVGIASLGLDAEVTSSDWRGSVTDRYAGFTAFGTLYF
ncbi:MAG: hypothetical protein ACC650_10120, partial [Gammaproteobacteria bacterium]